ncbi:MAG: glycosyltransferase family 4 protein [Candidatus Korobacteraceae bacterium]
MPLPRVAVLCAIAGIGGAELSLLELVARLRDSYEFHLLVPAEGPFQRSAELAGAKVWILPWPEAIAATGETAMRAGPVKILRAAACLHPFMRSLSELLDELEPAALITNAVKAHVIGALARKPQLPLIWYMRDGLEQRLLSRKLLSLLSRRCDLAVCISEYVLAQFREYVSPSLPAHAIYNIVDLSRFHPETSPPTDLPKSPNEIWFGIVGAITPLKGHDIFLDAAARVLHQLPNAVFVIVGNNAYRTERGMGYEAGLRRKMPPALADRVKFVGFRNDVPNLLSHLDVLVQPNRGPEGLGRSVLEAMACGLPVIAVDKWGPAELVQHGETGLLFSPLDTEVLAAHMLTLGRDESLRKFMGKLGHDWIQKNLVARKLAGQFDRVLSSVIASQLQEAVA